MNNIKRTIFEALLAQFPIVRVVFDPMPDSVIVPASLKKDEATMFEYGLDMRPIPIPDLDTNERGISATLSIDRTPFKTFVPWSAVVILHDGGRNDVAVQFRYDRSLVPEPTADRPKLRLV